MTQFQHTSVGIVSMTPDLVILWFGSSNMFGEEYHLLLHYHILIGIDIYYLSVRNI